MGQRIDVRSLHRNHRAKKKGEINVFGLAGKLKRRAVTIESKRTLSGGDLDRRLVVLRKQAFLDRTLWGSVDELKTFLHRRT